jgi:very-short-patch-repair endonuclease
VARRQEGAISTAQLLSVGLNFNAIAHRVAKGRLHPHWPGVFAVGRPELSQHGVWIAALLTCGDEAALSHGSAMTYYEIGRHGRSVEVSVPYRVQIRRAGIVVHRRRGLEPRHIRVDGPIRVTNPTLTLIDFAAGHGRDDVEAAINAADKRDLVSPDRLRLLLDDYPGWRGVPLLRQVLDIRTFTMTDSELERRFLPIARRVGLSLPQTQLRINGFKVDFYWPELGLVVETDGLRYHRTPAQQAADRIRDQVHTAAGLTPLRFTRAQVRYEPKHVETILGAVAQRLMAGAV